MHPSQFQCILPSFSASFPVSVHPSFSASYPVSGVSYPTSMHPTQLQCILLQLHLASVHPTQHQYILPSFSASYPVRQFCASYPPQPASMDIFSESHTSFSACMCILPVLVHPIPASVHPNPVHTSQLQCILPNFSASFPSFSAYTSYPVSVHTSVHSSFSASFPASVNHSAFLSVHPSSFSECILL